MTNIVSIRTYPGAITCVSINGHDVPDIVAIGYEDEGLVTMRFRAAQVNAYDADARDTYKSINVTPKGQNKWWKLW